MHITRNRPATATEKWLDKHDNFAATVKSFNFEGRQRVHTPLGLVVTFILTCILYAYGIKMFIKLVTGDNPNVITEIQPESFSNETAPDGQLDIAVPSNADPYNENKKPFKFAFAMRGYLDRKIKNDTSMVEWEVHVYKGNGSDEVVEHHVGVHTCNESDYAEFYSPSQKSRPRFEMMKNDGAFVCMNDYDHDGKLVNKKLFGPDENLPHRRIELIFKPCVPEIMTEEN